jgi:hypothetical protein
MSTKRLQDQEHPDTTDGMKLGTRSVYAKVRMVIKLIDLLLLNAEHYRFYQHGFTLLTESELMSILLSIGSHPESSETVYRWSYQLSLFLKMQIAMTDSSRLEATLVAFPALQENGVPQDEWVMDLIAEEIIRARAWLYLHQFYHPYNSKKQYAFHKVPNHSTLAALIYTNTLGGKSTNLPQFAELGIEPIVYTKREYPKHQLRRFFAMLFFWGSSFGGLDTLRWFLAHTDVEHLYHYITETTPGSVLRGAQAHYATEQLQGYDQNAEELADLLEQRFDTRKFDLMEIDELDAYIEDLIEEGSVMIEPEFFKDAEGENYRILIQVKEKKMTINDRENSTCRI